MRENVAKTVSEWVFVARSLTKLPNGQSQTMRCVDCASIAAQDAQD